MSIIDNAFNINNDIRFLYEWLKDSQDRNNVLDYSKFNEYNIEYDITKFKKIIGNSVTFNKSLTEYVNLIDYCQSQLQQYKKHTLSNIETNEIISFENNLAFVKFVKTIASHNNVEIKKTVEACVDYIENVSYKYLYAYKNNLIIRVGTDSQYYNGKAHYALVVAFDFGNCNGVHAIYKKLTETLTTHDSNWKTSKKRMNRKSNKSKGRNNIAIKERLNRETFFSMGVAYYIYKNLGIKCDIDLDYNSKNELIWIEENGKNIKKLMPVHLSGEIVQENIGFCESYGFIVRLKPETLIATPYADKLCRY